MSSIHLRYPFAVLLYVVFPVSLRFPYMCSKLLEIRCYTLINSANNRHLAFLDYTTSSSTTHLFASTISLSEPASTPFPFYVTYSELLE